MLYIKYSNNEKEFSKLEEKAILTNIAYKIIENAFFIEYSRLKEFTNIKNSNDITKFMFIRSPLATNDKLINLSKILSITPTNDIKRGGSDFIDEWCIVTDVGKSESYFEGTILNSNPKYIYNSKEDRDKAYEELCACLNTSYKLRDFT
jgi:hypothetical protein